jgi:hypothetical protein
MTPWMHKSTCVNMHMCTCDMPSRIHIPIYVHTVSGRGIIWSYRRVWHYVDLGTVGRHIRNGICKTWHGLQALAVQNSFLRQEKIVRYDHRVHTEWQRPLAGVHSIKISRGPFHYSTFTYKVAIAMYAAAERADTLPLFHFYSCSVLCGYDEGALYLLKPLFLHVIRL